MRFIPWIIAALVAAAAAAWWLGRDDAPAAQQGGARAVPVEVAAIERSTISRRTEAIGTALAAESVEIRPTVTDIIEAIHFSDGQYVEAGDPLVSLARSEELAQLAEARAMVAEQEREVRRIEGLVRNQQLPENQLDERRTMLEVAQHRLEAVQASLREHEIRAPFAGAVGLRQVSVGALVTPQTMITTLDDIDTIRLDFPVAEVYLGDLRPGLAVEARSPAYGDLVFTGEVVGIDSRINPEDRSVVVRAELPNEERLLKPGMLLNVELTHGLQEALLVPEEAIIHRQERHYAFRVVDSEEGPQASEVRVELGERTPGYAEVVSGLEAGDLVVVSGLMSVRNASPLRILGDEAAS